MQQRKVGYRLKEDGSFIVENYNFSKPFASFFPGIAGLYGIPMWVFFVNRGQGICSFGTNSKDQPILEFFPANQAYQMVFTRGFRTFIKINKKATSLFYEPFHDSLNNLRYTRKNRMVVNCANLQLEEHNATLGLSVAVDYFAIPCDNFAALVRAVTIRNTSPAPKEFELIDGLPIMIPYGVSNMFLKKLSRTIEAWMGIENLENRAPFYRLKVDPTDRPEVIHIEKGNFYLSFCPRGNSVERLRPIVDPACIFGTMGDLSVPQRFLEAPSFRYPAKQSLQSKTPCAFSFTKVALRKNQAFTLYSLFGSMEHLAKLNKNLRRIACADYVKAKRDENNRLLEPLMHNTATVSALPHLNLYAQRTFLDNVVRGGLPITLEHHNKTVVYVYSRKHGDLERDYNKFLTQATYFSQGDGNYRDVNQNRRNDIFFNPALGDANIKHFFNLIQLDGFNPLVIKGRRYYIDDTVEITKIIKRSVSKDNKGILHAFLSKPFYIGELFMFLEEHGIAIKDKAQFITEVIEESTACELAEHKEGFWIDHWTYNLDLLESFLSLFPEKLKDVFYDDRTFTFYDDYWVVNPRHKKYVLYGGEPKQLHAVAACKEKQLLIEERKAEPHTVRTEYGHGVIYTTNLLEKFVCIIVNKLASLDPFGVGIEMEANKPGWYDALNGLPALFGSSVPETIELKRWIVFTKKALASLGRGEGFRIALAEEFFDFCKGMDSLLRKVRGNSARDNFAFWDQASHLKEVFRAKTIFGISGQHKHMPLSDLIRFLDRALHKVELAIAAAKDTKTAAYTTYFINEVVRFERISEGKEGIFIKPLAFRQKPLALFLEGFVHALKIAQTPREKKAIYRAVRSSTLYDVRRRMYKVNASLKNEPEEIGRCRVFTPGWLENESIWVHMEYKYLLELLRAGLYDEFYRDFFAVLIPFQDPQVYGRSILENSSFIVSSVFPDKELHGSGFVARLSGSTAEFIHMWLLMNIGTEPFFIDGAGRLALRFRPVLSRKLFTKKQCSIGIDAYGRNKVIIAKNCYAFIFLGTTLVVYHNPKQRNTYGNNGVSVTKIVLEDKEKKITAIHSDIIGEEYAPATRAGAYARIDIYLS